MQRARLRPPMVGRLFSWLSMAVTVAAVSPGLTAEDLTVWAAAATRKIGRGDAVESCNRIWSSANRLITLHGAANENESFHLVLRAGARGLDNLQVSASDLDGPAGTIAAANISLFRQAYFDVPAPSNVEGHPLLGSAGPKADALIPFSDPYGSGNEIGVPFPIAMGSNQPIWVSIDIPPGTSPGRYQGQLTVSNRQTGQDLTSVTLRLEVWPFALPAAPTLATYYNIESVTIAEHHGASDPGQLDALVESYYQVLSRARMGAGYALHKLPSYDNQDGFDWSGAEAFWSRWLDLEQMPVVGVVPIFDGTRYRIQQADGSPYRRADLTPGSHFDTQARLFYRRLWDDLATRGWIDRTVVYLEDDRGAVSDEPYDLGADTYERIRSWADILHGPDPAEEGKRHRLLIAGDSIIPSAPYADLRGACDVWDMYMDEVDNRADSYRARIDDHPQEELWIVPNAYGDFIDYPAIYPRTLGWFCYKHGATGIEQWDVLAWYDAAEDLVDPWRPGSIDPVWGWGGGGLLYPGANLENRGIDIDGPVSSLRFELQRQSFEDWEYLQLLDALGLADLALGLAWGCLPGPLYGGLEIGSDQYERARALAGAVIATGGADTAVVEGTVSDEEGAAISGALVGNGTSAALTGTDGSYRLTLLAGTHTLNASTGDHLPRATTVTLAAGQTLRGIDLGLQPLARSETVLFGSFESDSDLWQENEGATVQRSDEYVSDGSYAMWARFLETAPEPLVATEEIAPSNWSQFDFLELDVYNASPYLTELEIEVADHTWTYFFEIYFLTPGRWRHIRLPLAAMSRDIDPSEIVEIDLYVDASGKGTRDLYLDHFRLVRVTGADTAAPAAPLQLAATATADGVALTWTAPATDADGGPLTGLNRYGISRAEGDAPFELLNAYQEVVSPVFLDREATDGTYSYVVRAIDQAGNTGPPSAEVQVAVSSRCGSVRRVTGRVRPSP